MSLFLRILAYLAVVGVVMALVVVGSLIATFSAIESDIGGRDR